MHLGEAEDREVVAAGIAGTIRIERELVDARAFVLVRRRDVPDTRGEIETLTLTIVDRQAGEQVYLRTFQNRRATDISRTELVVRLLDHRPAVPATTTTEAVVMQRLELTVEAESIERLATNHQNVFRRVLIREGEVRLEVRCERVGARVDHGVSRVQGLRPLGDTRRQPCRRHRATPDARVHVQARQHGVSRALRHATLLVRPHLRQVGASRLQLRLDPRENFGARLGCALLDFRVGGNRYAAVHVHQLRVVQRAQRTDFGLDRSLTRNRDVLEGLEHDVGAGNTGVLLVPDVVDLTQAGDAGRRPALTMQFDPCAVVEPVTAASRDDRLVGADLIQRVIRLHVVPEVGVDRRHAGEHLIRILVERVLRDQARRIFLQVGATNHQADGDQHQRAKAR